MKIKPIIYAALILIFAALFGLSINQKEALLAGGTEFYLELAPVDPRSLMQGDYMILNYSASGHIPREKGLSKIIMQKDERNVASVVGPWKGQALQPGQFTLKLYKVRTGLISRNRYRLAPQSYFFQEGLASKYDQARFALLKYDNKGQVLLVSLADKDLNTL